MALLLDLLRILIPLELASSCHFQLSTSEENLKITSSQDNKVSGVVSHLYVHRVDPHIACVRLLAA